MGADEVVQITEGHDPVEAVRALTPDRRGADVVIEAVGRPEAWEWAIDMVRKGGTVNFFGGCASGTKVRLDTNRLHYSEITLKATFHHTPESGAQGVRADRGEQDSRRRLHHRRSAAVAAATGAAPHAEPQRRHQDRHHSWTLRRRGNRSRALMSTLGELTVIRDSLTPARRLPARLGLGQLPAEYAIPDKAPSLAEAQAYCRRLATTHYENFSVATWFLPKQLRQHFYNVYAYCRISDDLGDEVGDPQQSLALLDEWEHELEACYASLKIVIASEREASLLAERESRDPYRADAAGPRHPVFIALRETIRACEIPQHEFAIC